MSHRLWTWGRLIGPLVVLGVLVWRLGADPFIDGLRMVDGEALAAATGLAVLTTVCCAWRWRAVARGLGVDLTLPAAIAAYYRSLFLNVTLPGGIVGDVHRGVSHGRDVDDVGRGLRAVVWERGAGQVVQIVLTVAVLLALPSPVQSWMPLVAVGVVAALVAVVALARVKPGVGRTRVARVWHAAMADIRNGLLARRVWVGIGLASAVVVVGHTVTFLIAAQTAGGDLPLVEMLPIALLVMAAMALPNIAGWGPREAVTAWAFAAVGLGAEVGVTTAVVYGVMVFVACLPGAAVVAVAWFRHIRPTARTERGRGAAHA